MSEFNTVKEAIEDIKQGKIIMVIEKMKVILYVPQNLLQQKILILWQLTEKGLFVCQ